MNPNNYKITIITAAYNSLNTFLDSYKSVLAQTYTNWEWIIIDDCSSDGSFEYIRNLVNDNPKIILKRNKHNSGSAVARNVGLKIATGRYVTFLDSDDFLDDIYLESQLLFIKENGPIITSGYRRIGNKTITNFIPKPTISYKKLLYGCDTSCLTTMFDRTIIQNAYFREDLLKDEDYVFWLEILERGYICKTNQRVLASYRISKTSKNGNKLKLFGPIFNVYHNVLKFNIFKTFWHIVFYFFYGLKKYHNVK